VNQSQTQPRTTVRSNLPIPQFTRKLNYDYKDKNTAILIRSVDRLNRTNQNTNAYNQNSPALNKSVTNLNSSKEEFYNQNYRSKLKSTSPKKFIEGDYQHTYTSPLRNQNQPMDTASNHRNAYENPNSNTVSNNNTLNGIKGEISIFLARFLQELTLNETTVEGLKESLSLKTDVKLNEIFRSFDLGGKGLICVPDFKETLNRSLEIFSGIEDIKLLFKRFDQDLDCKLSYNEFCDMLIPKKPEYARLIKDRKHYGYDAEFTLDSKLILIKLFRTLIDGENMVEKNRQYLTSRPLFSSYDAFDLIKGKYQNYILKENLNYFLQKHSMFVSQFELDALFDRFDKNRDGKITFNEFIQEVLPKSYYSY